MGKPTSELNELLKGKRNITVQWDILLSKFLETPPKKRLLAQIDYDYDSYIPVNPGAKIAKNPEITKPEVKLQVKPEAKQTVKIEKVPEKILEIKPDPQEDLKKQLKKDKEHIFRNF